MKPIHKLNNGRGATLCHTCSVIITTGLTEDLYCEKCKPKQETTLEEAAEIITTTKFSWEQEISYSEEDMKKAFINGMANVAINDFEFDVDTWFKQFKKK